MAPSSALRPPSLRPFCASLHLLPWCPTSVECDARVCHSEAIPCIGVALAPSSCSAVPSPRRRPSCFLSPFSRMKTVLGATRSWWVTSTLYITFNQNCILADT
ncbi:hypothetical protein PF011_g10654 [Phytophthora fragariae]|uniref:Uncharacterized protein n=1 Tax=Phytophthora fragariae TaxID=53985 RepID=A0A6A3KNB8_9STRA|nr:hypothetical protein PF011_g10654 [Phytophthora fragariae]